MSTPIDIDVVQNGNLLRITLTGERSTDEAGIAAWQQIADHAIRLNATHVLVINRLVGEPPTPELQRKIVQALAVRDLDGVQLAMVVPGSARLEHFEHGELDSLEIGRKMLVFGSEELAMLWLRHGLEGDGR
jgi:hypothetical protein